MNFHTITASVTTQVCVMFILILLGYFLTKKGILSSKGTSEMSTILLNVVTPCVLLRAYHIPFEQGKVYNLLFAYGICILLHIAYICFAKICFLATRDMTTRKINEAAAVYSNCGFMAIPLLSACLGSEGTFYGSAYLAVFNVFVWTFGKRLFESGKERNAKLNLLTPGTIGVIIGMFFYLTQLKLPVFAYNAVGFVADLNTPLAMVVLGNFLARSGVLKAMNNIGVYAVSAFRLIAAPLALAFVLSFFEISRIMALAVVICSACPVATIIPIFAKKHNSDYNYATNLTVSSTLLSLITIPFVCYITGLIF